MVVRSMIWTGYLLNTKQECQPVDCRVDFVYLKDDL
jgi:hypothetical protein